MKIVAGSGKVPVIYTAHHASHNFGTFADRVALTLEQQLRFSDYGTAETVPTNGIMTLVAEHSRALGDLNRDPDDDGRFAEQDYGRPDRHDIWRAGQSLTADEKRHCQSAFYEPFHAEIVNQLQRQTAPTFVVAWDNTAHYVVGNNDAGQAVMMPPFVLSNRGLEENAAAGSDEASSCDPRFLELLAQNFRQELRQAGLPHEVHLNLVMKGGYICRQYSTLRNEASLRQLGITCPVQSLQLEYDTAITHDQITLQPKPDRMAALQTAFNNAIAATCAAYSA